MFLALASRTVVLKCWLCFTLHDLDIIFNAVVFRFSPKKNGTWDATDIAKRRIKPHLFRHCLSRFFTRDDDLQLVQGALYCTTKFLVVDFNVIFAKITKQNTVHRTVCMTSRVGAQRPGLGHGTVTGHWIMRTVRYGIVPTLRRDSQNYLPLHSVLLYNVH